jgi:3-hydroxyisobutyrate dehydrogenase-like beta-hydroxyacid dehydrogenase
MQIAIFGLGKMGMQIAKRLQKNGFEVLAWNRSEEPRKDFEAFGGKSFAEIPMLVEQLKETPRVFC